MGSSKKKPIVPKGDDGLYHCPECPTTFEHPTALGIHRRMSHGVAGTSSASIAYRNAKKADAKAAKAAAKQTLTSLPPAIPIKALRGRPPKAKLTQPSMFEDDATSLETGDLFPCPGCTRVFTSVRGRTKHVSHEHPELLGEVTTRKGSHTSVSTSNLAVSKGHLNGNSKNGTESTINGNGETITRLVPTELVTYTVGQIKALCEGMAHQNDIPSRDFARRCAVYFHAVAGRQ